MRLYLFIIAILMLAPAVNAIGAVQLTFLNQNPDPVEPGEYVELRYQVENVGSFDLINLVVELEEEFPLEFDSRKDRMKVIPSLTAELQGTKYVTVKFRARINDNALTGDEEIRIVVRFPDGNEKVEDHIISIQSRDLLLGIEEVRLNPERPKPGSELDVSITIKNLGGVSAEDLTVKLGLADMPLATIRATNEKFLDKLRGGSSYTFNFSLLVGADAKSQLYQIPVYVNYKDKFGRNFNFSSNFGCAVEAPPEYIVNIDKSDIVLPNKKGNIVVSVSNIGSSDINYVSLELQPSSDIEILSNPLVYMGNLESDDYETAEFDLYVKGRTGELSLDAELTYKDSYNRNVKEVVPLTLRVYTRSEASEFGLIEEGTGIRNFVLLLLALGGGYYWYKRKRK